MEEEKKETLDQKTIDRLLAGIEEEDESEEDENLILEEEPIGEEIFSEELDLLRTQIQQELEQQQQTEQEAIEEAERQQKSEEYNQELKAREDEVMRISSERQAEMATEELEESQRAALAETLGKAQKYGAEHPGQPGLVEGAGVDPYAYEKAYAAEFVEGIAKGSKDLGQKVKEKIVGEQTPEEKEAEEKKKIEEEALSEFYGVSKEKLEEVLKQSEDVVKKESWKQGLKEEAIQREKERIRKYGTEEQKRDLALREARSEQEKARRKAEEDRLIGVAKYGTKKLETEAKELAGDKKWYKPWKEEGYPAMSDASLERDWTNLEQEIRSNIGKYPNEMYTEYLSLRDLREDKSREGITPTKLQSLKNLKSITDKKLASVRTKKTASKTAYATGRIAKGIAKGIQSGAESTVRATSKITERGGPGYKRQWEGSSPKIFGQSHIIPPGAQTRHPLGSAGSGEPKLKESPLSMAATRRETSAMMGKDVFGKGISSSGWESPIGMLGTQKEGRDALIGRISRGKMITEAKPMPSDISEITGTTARPLETGYERKKGYSPMLREMDITKIVAASPTKSLMTIR